MLKNEFHPNLGSTFTTGDDPNDRSPIFPHHSGAKENHGAEQVSVRHSAVAVVQGMAELRLRKPSGFSA
jgi:hypothetical protein